MFNLLLTECEGRTGEYWPEVVAVRTSLRSVRTKTTEGQYSPVRLELARLVSSLLYGTRTMLVLSLPAFGNKKYTAYDRFHRTVRMAKSRPRKNQSERSDLPCHIIKPLTNRARGPYWGILARGRGSTDRVQRGPYKNDRGPIFPSTA